jgi:hypothetical protein
VNGKKVIKMGKEGKENTTMGKKMVNGLDDVLMEQKVNPCKRGRKPRNQIEPFRDYSTVTDFARLRGWSTLQLRMTAIW